MSILLYLLLILIVGHILSVLEEYKSENYIYGFKGDVLETLVDTVEKTDEYLLSHRENFNLDDFAIYMQSMVLKEVSGLVVSKKIGDMVSFKEGLKIGKLKTPYGTEYIGFSYSFRF